VNTASAPQALSSGRVLSSDVAELDSDVDGANIRHAQLDAGEFEADLRRVSLVTGVLDMGWFNKRVYGNGSMRADGTTFGFVSKPQGAGHLNGYPLTRGIWLYQPADILDGTFPKQQQWFTFSIGRGAMESDLEAMGLDAGAVRKLDTVPRVEPAAVDRLEQMLQGIRRAAEGQGPLGNAANIEEHLLLVFLDALSLESPRRRSDSKTRPLLRHAEDFLRERVDRPLTTTELCRALACSRRQVERAFAQAYGMGPMAYHRRLRLNEVHRELLETGCERGSVSSIAVDFGFTHLGRFARDYRALFGESPRQTGRA